MLRRVLLLKLLVIWPSCAMEKPPAQSYDFPRPCAKSCQYCCQSTSWLSWSCGLICGAFCCLLKCDSKMPSLTAKAMAISRASENAANYFKMRYDQGK